MLLRPNESHRRVTGTNGLVAGAAPGGTNVYDLDNQAGSLINTATWEGWLPTGRALESTSTSDQGGHWPQPPGMSLGSRWSLGLWIAVDSVSTFGKAFCVPYRHDTSWNPPFAAIAFGKNESNPTWRLEVSNQAGTNFNVSTGPWSIRADGIARMLVLTVNGTVCILYEDGIPLGTANLSQAVTPYFGNRAPIHLCNRNYLSQSEGLDGRVGAWWLWDYVLTAQEAMDLALDPFLPIRDPLGMQFDLYGSHDPSVEPVAPMIRWASSLTDRIGWNSTLAGREGWESTKVD